AQHLPGSIAAAPGHLAPDAKHRARGEALRAIEISAGMGARYSHGRPLEGEWKYIAAARFHIVRVESEIIKPPAAIGQSISDHSPWPVIERHEFQKGLQTDGGAREECNP